MKSIFNWLLGKKKKKEIKFTDTPYTPVGRSYYSSVYGHYTKNNVADTEGYDKRRPMTSDDLDLNLLNPMFHVGSHGYWGSNQSEDSNSSSSHDTSFGGGDFGGGGAVGSWSDTSSSSDYGSSSDSSSYDSSSSCDSSSSSD